MSIFNNCIKFFFFSTLMPKPLRNTSAFFATPSSITTPSTLTHVTPPLSVPSIGRLLYSTRPHSPIDSNYELIEWLEPVIEEQEHSDEGYASSASSDSSSGASIEYQLEDPWAEAVRVRAMW